MLKKSLYSIFMLLILTFSGCGTEDETNVSYSYNSTSSISTGITYSDSISSYGTNYYSVYLTAGQSYDFSAFNLSTNSDLDIYIYSDSAFTNYVSFSFTTSTTGETVTYTPGSSGYYYFTVQEYSGVSVNYSLKVSTSPVYSEGSTSSPVLTYTGTKHSGGADVYTSSYYYVYLNAGTTYTFAVSNLSASADLDIYTYTDSTYTSSSASATNAGTAGETLTVTTVNSGYYYFKVYNFSGSNTTFDLDIN